MILAAGRGERMRPLTDNTPKPLLEVGGKPLIVWHIERLADANFKEIVINHSHLGDQLIETIGSGKRWGVRISWSAEPETALETAGGIAHALPLLGFAPFLVVNGDIWTDYEYSYAHGIGGELANHNKLAHIVMVPNPPHNPEGDFGLMHEHVMEESEYKLTFAGIGIYQRQLFNNVDPDTPTPLGPILREAIREDKISGEYHNGHWFDVGTPERLKDADRFVKMNYL